MTKILLTYQVMAKPTGPICNLNCTYCYYLEKEKYYPGNKDFTMKDDVLEEFIKQYIESHNQQEIAFSWQGGESTILGVDYFRKVVGMQKKYAEGKQINNSFQTNGMLLDDEWCRFFAENNFLVGISIDGPQFIHDRYRLDKGDHPTFEKVVKGINLLQKYRVEYNALTVIQKHNSYYPLQVYKFLRDLGVKYIQFIPIVERRAISDSPDLSYLIPPDYDGHNEVTEWSTEPEQFGNFLIEVFDEWVRKDVSEIYVLTFDVALESWFGVPQHLCVFSPLCGGALVIEHNGDLYSCDHYVYPENKLGNIMDKYIVSMAYSTQQIKFGKDKKDGLPQYCLDCNVRFACNGECPKHRFLNTSDGEFGLNYLCSGYKKFFNYIDPYMKFMADELRSNKAPANVMQWIEKNDIKRFR
jgi:uncharacterized protein